MFSIIGLPLCNMSEMVVVCFLQHLQGKALDKWQRWGTKLKPTVCNSGSKTPECACRLTLLLFVFLCTASLACIGFLSPPDSLSSIHYFSIRVEFSGTKERVVTSNFSGRIHHMLVNLNTFLLCLLSVSQLLQLLHLSSNSYTFLTRPVRQ